MADAKAPARKQRDVQAEPVRKAPAPPKPQLAPLLAVISIADQRVTLYGAGADVLARSPISSGQEGYRTPTGVFSIIQKNRYHESNIYSGAPMPFMQRITWSGVAMHEGRLPGYPASHGCIRLPGQFASQLWGMTRLGARVIVSPRDTSAEPFAHERLPVPALRAPDAATASATLVSNVVVADAGPPATDAASRLLNPLERAQELRVATVKAEVAAIRTAKEALENSATRSAEHRDASAALRTAQAGLTEARLRVQALARVAATAGSGTDQSPGASNADAARLDLEDAEDRHAFAKADEQAKSDDAFAAARAARDAEAAVIAAAEAVRDANRRLEPLSIFVSRQEGRVFFRQGFEPIFDAPVVIRDPDQPLGTHVLVAMEADAGGEALRWINVSVPTSEAGVARSVARGVQKASLQSLPPPSVSVSTRAALERFELPAAAQRIISERLWVGASLIVSDFGVSNETGKGTDFIVLTR